MQATVTPEMQGRVFGLLGSLFSLTTPIGLGIVALVGNAVEVSFWFRLGGIMCLLVALVSFFIPAFRTIEEHKFNGSSTKGEPHLKGTPASD